MSLHSSNEPSELSQRLCYDDSTINVISVNIIIIINGAGGKDSARQSQC